MKVLLAMTVAAMTTIGAAAPAPGVTTDRVSVATDGTQGDGASILPTTDDSGRLVAFASSASNLVAGDTNGVADVFLRDTATGATELVSAGTGGVPADRASAGPQLSADGRYVVYYSEATNLTADPPTGPATFQVYVHDRETGTTERIPAGNQGGMVADISGDGRLVTFQSWSTDLVAEARSLQVYVHDRETGQTGLVSRSTTGAVAGSGADAARISADGRFVAFLSGSDDIVAGDTNDENDVFVRDLRAGSTALISVAADGTQADGGSSDPSISADGSVVAYSSSATTIVAGDTNTGADLFVHDATTGATELISTTVDGGPLRFASSQSPDVSADGRRVAFWSSGWDLVPDDTNYVGDTFVHDRTSATTTRVSVTSDGQQTGGSDSGVLSADGRTVFYRAGAADLVPGDTNGVDDIFRGRLS